MSSVSLINGHIDDDVIATEALTDEQIIKAIERCIGKDFTALWYVDTLNKRIPISMRDILRVISNQKEEIDELYYIAGIKGKRKYYRKFVDEVYHKEKGNELCEPDFDYIYELYFKQQAEIERLQNESIGKCELAMSMRSDHSIDVDCNYCVEQAKSEAVKEFAERFENELTKIEEIYFDEEHENFISANKVIALLVNLVKEMVGDTDV